MAASTCVLRALLLGVFVAAPARAEERAELTFSLESANLVGDARPGPAPWDSLEGFRSGRDTRARLRLGVEEPGRWRHLSTGASLRMDLALAGAGQETELRLRDASSWLGVTWHFTAALGLALRAYPLDTDYVRLGHAHALDFGGTDVARRESVFLRQTGGAPGAELAFSAPRVKLFAWLKSAQLSEDLSGPRRVWGAAAGASFELARPWRVDLGFGFFQRPPTFLEGATVRLVYRRGVDEPELSVEPFRPAPFRAAASRFSAESRLGFALALEAVTVVTKQRRYEDPSLPVTTVAPAAALYGSLRSTRWAFHGLLSLRSVPFLLKNDPRVLPEQALPATASSLPELGAWLGASVDVLSERLVPSIELGARLPAALVSVAGDGGAAQTFIVGGPAGFESLPPGFARRPALAARAALRAQASPRVSFALLAEYQRDPNRSSFSESPTGVTRRPAPADTLTGQLAAQARF